MSVYAGVTEVRSVSSTGGEKGVKPERHDLIPVKGVAAIARVFGFGAEKYADHNWRKKYEWGKSIAALNRHIDAFADGETLDPESGLPHLAHAGFHILVLLTWLEEDGEGIENPFDDRWPTALERARLAEEGPDLEEVADQILEDNPPRSQPGISQLGPGFQGVQINPLRPNAESIQEAINRSLNRMARARI